MNNKRVGIIQNHLIKNDLDAILIRGKTGKKWLETLTGSNCSVLITKEQVYLILDGRYLNQARDEKANIVLMENQRSNYLEYVLNILKDGRLGIEGKQTSIQEYQYLLAKNIKISLIDQDLINFRMIKDLTEIEILKEATRRTDIIYQEVINKIKVGMSEQEIAALLHYYSFLNGATRMAFEPIVASGKRTALPHGRPTSKTVTFHEPIMIDFGIEYQGYESDMTRVCFIGQPDKRIKEIYDLVLKAQKTGVDAIKSGIKACEVDKIVRDIISDAGYGQYFVHGLGHGIGLDDSSDGPILNKNSQTILQEGMVMSCEPGIYIPDIGGIRIEDDVVILNGKGLALNKTTKDYIILEVD